MGSYFTSSIELPPVDTFTPGLKIFCGSKACFTCAKSATERASHTRSSSGVRRRPSPCSPARVPPSCAVSDVTSSRIERTVSRQSRLRTSMSGFTCTCESPACPKMTPRTSWRARISRTPRTYCGRRSGGIAESSMNCIDLSEGERRFRIGLAACRSAQRRASSSELSAMVTRVAPHDTIACSITLAVAAAAAASPASISMRSTASLPESMGTSAGPLRATSMKVRSSSSHALAPPIRARAAPSTACSSVGNSATRLLVAPGSAASESSIPTKSASVPSLPMSSSSSSPLRA